MWQGLALYQAGDYAAAALRFAEVNSASAHYNRGNALAMSGELEAAIDAYEQALELQPDLSAAAQNKALIESLLAQKHDVPPVTPEKEPEPGAEPPASDTAVSSNTATNAGAAVKNQQEDVPVGEANLHEVTPSEGTPAASGPPGTEPDTGPAPAVTPSIDEEHRQALEQWLKQIPDNPGELLRRKFWYEQQQHQDTPQ